METKMITIPFDVELAKKIQAGEHPGKIVTREEKDVEILCFDAKSDCPIVYLVTENEKEQSLQSSMNNGRYYCNNENRHDLVLQVPEWAQYKEGDIVCGELIDWEPERWVGVLKDVRSCESFNLHTVYYYNRENKDVLFYEVEYCRASSIRYATEEERKELIEELKADTDHRAKDILKRFFNIEEKPEYKFEPFQQVLVRNSEIDEWECSLFSNFNKHDSEFPFVCVSGIFNQCIPYNEQTKHLLGTKDNWEGE